MSAVKFVMLIWRKPGLTHEAFRDYYETRHAPLGARLLPPAADYRRNFPLDGASAPLGGFDVVTEVWHTGQLAFERQIAARQLSPAREQLDTDETAFMNRERKVFITLDERRFGVLDAHEGAPAVRAKLLRFVRAPAGMSRETFRMALDAAVRARAPDTGELRGYRCNFVTGVSPAAAIAVDAIEELWLEGGLPPAGWPVLPGMEAWWVPVAETSLENTGAMAPMAGL